MAAAVLGCILPFIMVDNKACVSKTYPEVAHCLCTCFFTALWCMFCSHLVGLNPLPFLASVVSFGCIAFALLVCS
jgi:hypothetical protein